MEQKEKIIRWIEQHESKAFICRQLKCKPETLDSYLQRFGVTYKGNAGLKGKKTDNKRLSALDYATRKHCSSHRLKLKLIEDGLKQYECEICKTTEWMGEKIPLELDHIDGNHFNNSLDNLRVVCPNCHAQQVTNSGKNVKYFKR
jgi:Zn finger protein HypA/HybF involved in hydrogenase expression